MAPSSLAVRRIMLDTKRVIEDKDIAESGIFWVGDELDLTHGWAFVCGMDGTPYHGGIYCFEVKFPDNYPFEPPAFTYLTNDGRNRFNPNLYKNGKVCISLLNTWQGEQWSGVQSLGSILQCIQTAVLINDPLRNEPAYSNVSLHVDIPVYNRIIFHANVETAILSQLTDPPPYLVPVLSAARAHALKCRDEVVKKLQEMIPEWNKKTEAITFYSMTQKYQFDVLLERLKALV
jgi:ubiquitin-protein ligase